MMKYPILNGSYLSRFYMGIQEYLCQLSHRQLFECRKGRIVRLRGAKTLLALERSSYDSIIDIKSIQLI